MARKRKHRPSTGGSNAGRKAGRESSTLYRRPRMMSHGIPSCFRPFASAPLAHVLIRFNAEISQSSLPFLYAAHPRRRRRRTPVAYNVRDRRRAARLWSWTTGHERRWPAASGFAESGERRDEARREGIGRQGDGWRCRCCWGSRARENFLLLVLVALLTPVVCVWMG